MQTPGESGLFNRIGVLRAERGISRQDLADAVGSELPDDRVPGAGRLWTEPEAGVSDCRVLRDAGGGVFSMQPFKPLSEQVYGSTQAAAKEKS